MWSGRLKERIGRAGLELADIFIQPWTDKQVMAINNPDPVQREDSTEFFLDMLELASRVEAPGMTILPGVHSNGQNWEEAMRLSSEGLTGRLEKADQRGVSVSIEAHAGSIVDTPARLSRLIDLTPGLRLTLDYSHFTYAGIPDRDVEPLLSHTRHFHCRGAAKGKLQTTFEDNTVDYQRVIERMREIGYTGYFAIEYVWVNWHDLNQTENTSETILFRDFTRATMDGREYAPPFDYRRQFSRDSS